MSFVHLLPNEIIELISDKLSAIDLFHFTLTAEYHLTINNNRLIRLLRSQPNLELTKEIKSLLQLPKSPYIIFPNHISLVLSSYKWNNYVYGCFKIDMIHKSLKYYSTPMFFVYCRLWSFTPFHYTPSYPVIDLFQYPCLLQPRALCFDESTLFKVLDENQCVPKIVGTFDQFIQNFTVRYEYDIWGSDIDWNSFIVAGGSVISSLHVKSSTTHTSDVDLFFLKEKPWMFKRAVDQLENRLQNKYYVRRKTIWLNRLVQFDLYRKLKISDIFSGKTFIPSVIIQLICPTNTPTTVSRILHSFDLDICAAAFNSKAVIISLSCLQALNSGHTMCYALPLSTSQFMRRVTRLHKYQQRGYNILCPRQFDVNQFLGTSIEDYRETRPERLYRFKRRHFGDNCDSFAIQEQFCQYYNLI